MTIRPPPLAQGSNNAGTSQDDEPADLTVVYGDLSTIDWMRDWMRDHRRRFKLFTSSHTVWGTAFERSQSWILVLAVGISIGLIAGSIDTIVVWLTDVRFGYCKNEWYTGKQLCCKNIEGQDGNCSDWADWSGAIFNLRGLFLINWTFYVIFSTLLATTSAYLVSHISLYASGSGTAEIKTILGGFVIKEFLGLRTLLAKAGMHI